ncbi:MAG: calcium-translocating P-type ATPase, PMCA-type [Bacteroidaceae bacterium]|nr:calcium-translocating P-type ATPase, PMCA-type [Bacteroidaceae bacterium]
MNRSNYKKTCLVEGSEDVVKGKGKNVIPPPEKESLWEGFVEKFKDPIIVILLVVFVLSVGISMYEIFGEGKPWTSIIEPLGILVALLLATGVGFIFEVRANREFAVLNKVKDHRKVKVFRKFMGKVQLMEIPKHDVVVGDVVHLESGDEIPADGTLLEDNSLRVDESNFTGELYATKTVDAASDTYVAAYPADKLLRSSIVIEGTGVMRVDSVGVDTEEGRGVMRSAEGSDVKTPLNQQLDRLGHLISIASFVIACLIVVARLIVYFSNPDGGDVDWVEFADVLLNSILIAVTLIVVAVPEGLPLSVTLSMALSMRKMLKQKNLVRKLHACETMGAATVICTDKTGTLTQNRMKVMESAFFGDEDATTVARHIACNSTAELTYDAQSCQLKPIGNPTEGALLLWLNESGIDYAKIREEAEVIDSVPFSTETKYMSTTVRFADSSVCRYIKGAPEILLEMCDTVANGVAREVVEEKLASMQSRAMRTLAFAYQEGDGPVVFYGIVGIADPVREGVAEAIRICRTRAGVRVIIVTGDTAGTALEIGHQVGLVAKDEQHVGMTGAEFASLSDEEAKERIKVPSFKIISRARPEDKARLVMLLQELGEVVAVTGDGTNDAPALSKAQVGLSMGDGTARAKEASDITIIDNSFLSINNAIMWGRSLYLNIKRFILFQMTINICACLLVLLGAFIGLDSPLTVTQMLWVNLIMDTFAAMALASLPADKSVMYHKPRNPKSNIIDRAMAKQTIIVGFFFFVVMGVLWQIMGHDHINLTDVSQIIDSIKQQPSAIWDFSSHTNPSSEERSIFFTFFIMLQFWNIFNARYFMTRRSMILDICSMFSKKGRQRVSFSKGFFFVVAIILVGQYFIVQFGGEMFSTDPMSWHEWGLVLLLTSPVLIIPDVLRTIKILSK